jgi:lysophospholipase L1-like esterase
VVVYGTSLSDTSEWPKALKAYFDRQFPGLVTFTNAASSGKESNWGVANLQERVLSKNPDLIFIEFSMNDAATKHNISPKQAAANLDSMVKSLRRQNPQMDIVLQTMNSVFDGNDGKQAATARPNLETYYEGYRKYAREQGLPLIDHYPNWRKLQQEDGENFKKWLPDGTHPVPKASIAVTWPAIQALLEKARAGAGGGHPDTASASLRIVIVGDSTVAACISKSDSNPARSKFPTLPRRDGAQSPSSRRAVGKRHWVKNPTMC